MVYILKNLVLGFVILINLTSFSRAEGEKAGASAEVLFFYNPGCYHCLKVKNEVLPQLLKNVSKEVKIRFLDIGEISNYQLLLGLEEKFPIIGQGDRPKIFVNNVLLAGEKAIRENLIEEINKLPDKSATSVLPRPSSQTSSLLLKRFKSFNVLTIAAAGFLDGLNPCAFAVIVFFISFLTLMNYERKEIVIVGLTFVVAVFITYFLLGLGILKGLQRLTILYSLAKGVNLVVGIFAFVLAFFSFRDFYLYKKTGNTKDIKLKLSQTTHSFIHRVINKYFYRDKKAGVKKSLVILSCVTFLVGVLIAICTAACTGQVYLPTIVFMLSVPALKTKAILYLIIYNLMYIFPLAVIFSASLLGLTSEKLACWGRRRFGIMKVLLGVLFLVLGIILIKEGI